MNMKAPDLSKVADPFEADAQVQTPEPEAKTTPEPEVKEPAAPTAEQLAQENATLKAQLEAAQKVQVVVQPQAQPQVQMPQPSAEALQKQAEDLGFTDPRQIESIGRIAAHVAAPALQKAMILEQELKVEKTVNAAKKQAQVNDPQFVKLEAHVDEYLDGIPVQDKMDPEKLSKHMERATFYAKGKMGVSQQGKRATPPAQTPKADEGQEDKVTSLNQTETWETKDGKTRLVIHPRVKAEIRAMHAHPGIQDAVQMDPRDEWRGPIFQKDLINK